MKTVILVFIGILLGSTISVVGNRFLSITDDSFLFIIRIKKRTSPVR